MIGNLSVQFMDYWYDNDPLYGPVKQVTEKCVVNSKGQLVKTQDALASWYEFK